MAKNCVICNSNANLTQHHIKPKKAGGSNHPANLVILCLACHALVERYYWRVMSQTYPHTAHKYKILTTGFINKEIPSSVFELAKLRQKELLSQLLSYNYDWFSIYKKAVDWVQSVQPIKEVSVKDAIILKPWWIVK